MARYLNNLRKKPKHVRENIAFSVAAGFTVALAIAWFLVGFDAGEPQQIAEEDSPAAFSTLLTQIQEQVASARDSVSEQESEESAPVDTGEWGYSAQNASTTKQPLAKEANIMIVSAASSSASSTATTSNVVY